MKKIGNTLFLFIFPFFLSAQYFSKTIDLNQDANTGWKIVQSNGGLLIAAGSRCNNNAVSCVSLLKTTFDGDVDWQEIIEGYKLPRGESMIVDDEHIIIAVQSLEDTLNRIHVLQLDLEANPQQEWHFGAEYEDEQTYSLHKYRDGYVLENFHGDEPEYGWVQFLDANFENTHNAFFQRGDGGYDAVLGVGLRVTADDHLIGMAVEGNVISRRAVLTKLDSIGEVVWQQKLNTTSADPNEFSLLPLEEGGFIAGWNINVDSIPIISSWPNIFYGLDNEGSERWDHRFYTPYPSQKLAENLFRAANGDIVGMGFNDFDDENGARTICGWIFRMTIDGEVRWDRTICDLKSPIRRSNLYDGLELDDGDLVFTGGYQDTFPNGIPAINDPNVWLLRLDSEGCLEPGCGEWQILTATEEAAPVMEAVAPFRLFPNPVRQELFIAPAINGGGKHFQNLQLELYNSLGQAVFRKSVQPASGEAILLPDLPPGYYGYALRDQGRLVQSGKLILLK